MIGQTIAALGDAVSRRWTACGNMASFFPAIASEELSASGLLSHRIDELATWTMTSDEFPQQQLRPFGQPPINLFRGDGFFIEGLVRHEGIIGIHDHPFSGAFGILHGQSIHARYRFQRKHAMAEDCWLGSTELESVELLYSGAVREIVQGEALTHGLFHVDRPTVSVVVRTDTDPNDRGLQILFPSLLVPSRIGEPDLTRVAFMQSLAGTNWSLFCDLLPRALVSLSPGAAALVGGTAMSAADGPLVRESLRGLPDSLADAINAASLSIARTNRVLEARRSILGRDERTEFFLALLATVSLRGAILEVLGERFGADPVRIAADLVERFVFLTTGKKYGGSIAAIARCVLSGDPITPSLGDASAHECWAFLVCKRYFEPLLAG